MDKRDPNSRTRASDNKKCGESDYCDAHIGFVSDVAVIKNTLLDIANKTNFEAGFKVAVIVSLIGVLASVWITSNGIAKEIGSWENQVQNLTSRVDRIETNLENHNGYKGQ